jgi:glutathione S-transferase
MTAPYRLLGADLSPYTAKVRAALSFKGIEHTYVTRSPSTEDEFQRHARLPLLPILIGSDDFSLQDSTPMLAILEERHPAPPAMPSDSGLAFLAVLLEEYADEWVNKMMFHYRWSKAADTEAAVKRIVDGLLDGVEGADREATTEAVRTRMTGRLGVVGSSDANGPIIEQSFLRLLRLLDGHLGQHVFLLGGRPSAGDFALAAQLGQLASDPTPAAILRREAPLVSSWVEMTLSKPKAAGDYATFDELGPTLAPLLSQEVANTFLVWSKANNSAMRDGVEEFSVSINGEQWSQEPQKYAGKTFGELRRKRQETPAHDKLDALLTDTGVESFMRHQQA